jgi:hypothetical protein
LKVIFINWNYLFISSSFDGKQPKTETEVREFIDQLELTLDSLFAINITLWLTVSAVSGITADQRSTLPPRESGMTDR